MNELITAALKHKTIVPLLEFPRKLLLENETKVIDWIVEYDAKYGETPSLDLLEKTFDMFVALPSRGAPLQAIYDSILNDRILSFVNLKMTEAIEILEIERKVPLDILGEIQAITALSQQIYKFSTFDRKGYASKAGIKTGLKLIDAATGGIRGGDYALIVGRLGTGKTTLASWFAVNWWRAGNKVLFISNEMLPSDTFAKLDGIVGKFNPLILRDIDEGHLLKLAKTMATKAKTSEGDIIIPATRLLTPARVFSIAKSFDVDVVVIDGVYLMQADYEVKGQKWERISAISNGLKQHAMSTQKPCLGVTQLKRIGNKEDLDPEDIAFSDSLGQDADIIIALRPNKLIATKLEAQLIKNRYGSRLATEVVINWEHMTLTETSVEAIKLEEPEEGRLW